MSRNVSILSVMVMMTVMVMATVTVALATPNKGGSSQENGQGNGREKIPICHNGHTITVGEPAVAAHERHGDAPTLCENEETPPVPPDGATPELTTVATDATLGAPISDTATLSGATSDATGTIAFKLYGPFTGSDPSQDQCTADKLVFETVPSPGTPSHVPIGSPPNAEGNYVVESPTYLPTTVGRYQWVVSYSGDAKNEAVTSVCKAPNEASLVTAPNPTSTTE